MQFGSGQPTYGSKIAHDLVIALGESPNQEEVLCRCPLCGDSQVDPHKRRFAVNIDKGKFYCFNCLRSGQTIEMAQILLTVGHMLGKSKVQQVLQPRKPIDFDLTTISVNKLPPGLRQEVLDNLLHRRVFSEDQILELDYAVSGSKPRKWNGRIIIESDGLKFGKAIKKDINPKYLTQPNFKLIEHGFINLSNVAEGIPIILTEGVLDLLSLPADKAIMSPGTSGLFNDLVRTTSHHHPLIEVPDSDPAGVTAFLRLINKNMLEDPQAQLRFCFVYWITRQMGDDINDLLMTGLSKEDVYDKLVRQALPGPMALNKLKSSFPIERTRKGWELIKNPKGASDVTKRPVDNKNRQTGPNTTTAKKGPGKSDKLSWF